MNKLEQAARQALEALNLACELIEHYGSGYGFACTENPHRFCPDVSECSAEEISTHSAACDAYSKGDPIPKGSWGIGSYTGEPPKEIVLSATALRDALDHIADAGKVIPQFIPVGIVNDHHSITWMEEIVDDQAPIGAILYALQDGAGRNVSIFEEAVCNWRQPTYDDAECNAWQSDCDQYWAITEGTPTDNGMKFCHGCGKPIKEHLFVDSEEQK